MSNHAQLAAEPEKFVNLSNREAFSIPPQELAQIQLKAVQARFENLAPRISVLGRLAAEQSMDRIDSLDALAPLLVPHSAYKSYPMSALENTRFDTITRWLSAFLRHERQAVFSAAHRGGKRTGRVDVADALARRVRR
jgi:hypothetical protein